MRHQDRVSVLDDIRIDNDLPPSARYPSARVSASARLSASKSSAGFRQQLQEAREAVAQSNKSSRGAPVKKVVPKKR